MDESSENIQKLEEEDEKNEIVNLENDNLENSTEHVNRPLLNVENNNIKMNANPVENLKLIQDRINQEINAQEFEELKLKKNSKENSSIKGTKKYYNNLIISNNNFHIPKSIKKVQNQKNIQINNYIFKTNNNINPIQNKYMKYDDELKRYYFSKEFSNLHINTEENFLERMKFDIYKRQIKEKKIDDFIENNKVKIKEEKKIKTFNHLIEDANRRLKAQINSEILNTELDQDLLKKNGPKKYNDDEWDIIYKKRFKNYLDKVNKKKKENIKFYEDEKKKKQEEILKLFPNKKASKKHIKEMADKMYEEAMKRNVKKKELIEKSNNIKISKLSINNKLKNNKSASKIVKRNKDNIFLKNKISNLSQNKYKNNIQNKDNDYDYILEKERKLLIQMASTKKLPEEINNNKLILNDVDNIHNKENDINIAENNQNKESDKIIDEFLMRQII